MDPQAALDELDDVLDSLAAERDAARHQALTLLNWMNRGGFPPEVTPARLASLARLAESAGFARPVDMPASRDPLTLVDLLQRIAHD